MSYILLNQQEFNVNTIYCVGRNYVAHITELAHEVPTEPLIFLKPNRSLCRSGSRIHLPEFSRCVHYEAELVLAIGQDADELDEANALEVVAGYGVGLDLTARDVQNLAKDKGLPWTKAKGFKDSACVSDFVPAAAVPDPTRAEFLFYVNDELRQHGHPKRMIYPPAVILCELARTYGLRRGDLVFTGTPEGVGELKSGDALHLQLVGQVEARFEVA